ncbi:hypothetical protein [Actinoallomurus sp. CA-142502]|uniref:hypothetical protein n=1 Tax=Actinoallomurus sp. CA-142502 TaxID=3239885 RepID=UPI003D942158
MTGSIWWHPGSSDGSPVPDHPPVYLGPAAGETLRFPTDETADRLVLPATPEHLTVTFTADTTSYEDGLQRLLLALAVRFTAICPGCRRETHWLDYDLEAESCRACLEIIPRLQRIVAGAHVDWAPVRLELHWRPTR